MTGPWLPGRARVCFCEGRRLWPGRGDLGDLMRRLSSFRPGKCPLGVLRGPQRGLWRPRGQTPKGNEPLGRRTLGAWRRLLTTRHAGRRRGATLAALLFSQRESVPGLLAPPASPDPRSQLLCGHGVISVYPIGRQQGPNSPTCEVLRTGPGAEEAPHQHLLLSIRESCIHAALTYREPIHVQLLLRGSCPPAPRLIPPHLLS